MAFIFPQRVRFQHCDPAGIVFFPRYFEMVNATVEEWFAVSIGMSFAEMHGPTQGGVPTASIRADFRAPSRLGDLLDWRLAPRRLGRSSCELAITATCGDELRAEFVQTIVWIDMASGRPRSWPEDLHARMSKELDTEGDAS
jgi:4-hydroxybenzoyl-CoA thioesterase